MLKIIKADGQELACGETYTLTKPEILEFMKLDVFTKETITEHCDWSGNNYFPLPLTVKSDADSVILRDGRGEREIALTDGGAKLTNLIPGESYSVVSGNESISFTCTDLPPRMLELPSVDNTRDAGGKLTADGKRRMKYGMLYRGARLAAISDEDADTFVNVLKIKTELDVTGGCETSEKLKGRINLIPCSLVWYQHIFNGDENYRNNLRNAVKVFADEANYPIYFHCSLGRDRTGTVFFILGALCGLSKEDLYREHLLTFFSCRGDGENAGVNAHLANINALCAGFEAYGKPTLREDVEAFLGEIGVNEDDISRIREILTEEL